MSERQTVYRRLNAVSVASAELRTARFNDSDHLVVPVIMLIGNTVVRPMGSRGPEFVPAEELNTAVGGWNGRPVLPDHPDGSANEPAVLEANCFGYIFNTRFDDGKLKAEAWLNLARAAALGGDPQSVVDRCRAGEIVEISVGAYVLMEERAGDYNGQPYEFVWHNPVPDHLAMLPVGVEGACSVEMGCGAPRLMRAMRANQNDKEPTMFDRIRALGAWLGGSMEMSGLAKEKGQSDNTLRQNLESTLFASVPAFMGVSEVYPDSKTVIYVTGSWEAGYQYWRQGYAIDGDAVALSGDAEKVVQEVVYTPMSAIDPAVAKTACSCQSKNGDGTEAVATQPHAAPTEVATANHDGATAVTTDSTPPVESTTNLEGDSMDTKTLAGRLIASARSPFTEDHRAQLEAMSAEALGNLDTQFGGDATPAAVAAVPAVDQPAAHITETKSEEEIEAEQIAALPSALRALAQEAVANRTKERNSIIAQLTKRVNGAISTETLKAKTLDQLRELAAVAALTVPKNDFSGARVHPVALQGAASAPPDPYDLKGMSERRGQRAS